MSKEVCPFGDCGKEFDSPRALSMHIYTSHGYQRAKSTTEVTKGITSQSQLSNYGGDDFDKFLNQQMKMQMLKQMQQPQNPTSGITEFLKIYQALQQNNKKTDIQEIREWVKLAKSLQGEGGESDVLEQLIPALLLGNINKPASPSHSGEELVQGEGIPSPSTPHAEDEFDINKFIELMPEKIKTGVNMGLVSKQDLYEMAPMFDYTGVALDKAEIEYIFTQLRKPKSPVSIPTQEKRPSPKKKALKEARKDDQKGEKQQK